MEFCDGSIEDTLKKAEQFKKAIDMDQIKHYVWQMPARTAHFQMGTFQTLYDIDFKSKVVSFNEENLKMILDLNPIRHRGHLTLFYPV